LAKYAVVPDPDPQSLQEAKHLMEQVRARKGSALQQPFDRQRLDWIQVWAKHNPLLWSPQHNTQRNN